MDEDIAKSNQRNFRRLVLSVKASYGALNLIVAICDNPRYRDELIAAYEAELSAEGVDCCRVTIDRNDPSLKQCLLDLVNEKGSLNDRPCVVTALGADDLLNVRLKAVKSAQERFSFSLQWTRESFRDFKVPIVIWVSSSMANMLASSAPDFWSWRTGPFEFERSIEYQPIDHLQQFDTTTYSDEPIADPFEIEQQIKILLADDPESPLLRSLYQSLGIAYQQRTEQGKAIDYAQEQQLGIEALNKAIALQEPFGETLELADSLNTLAEIYCPVGRYQEAEELLKRSIAIRTQNLGRSHPDIARSLNDLAVIYDAQGQHSASEQLYVEALKIRKEQLGDRHLDTAMSLNNLASLYYSVGRYESAEPLLLSSLETRKEQLGDRHPRTADSLNNLAFLYYSMGRYESAEPLYLESLEIRKEQLGDRHPDTASTLNNLAQLYRSMGRYESAEHLFLQSLEIRKEQLGDRHPATASSLNNLSVLYYSMGRYESAALLNLESLEINREQLGDRHPNTATSLNNLALLYELMGRYESAEPLFLQSLEIRKEQLGDRHPDTASSLNNLAFLYYRTDRLTEAVAMMSEVVKVVIKTLGNKHPDTIESQKSLTLFQKKLKETEAIKTKVDEAFKQIDSLQSSEKPNLFTNKPPTRSPISWKPTIPPPDQTQ